MFYKKKDSAEPATTVPINNGATYRRDVTGLDKYTEYEFQVLAFTFVGDGPKSSVEVERTMQDGKMRNICTEHASKSLEPINSVATLTKEFTGLHK